MPQKITAAYRWPDDIKTRIAKRAKAAHMSETDYVAAAALGELREPSEIEARIDALEAELTERIERLEGAVNLGGFG